MPIGQYAVVLQINIGRNKPHASPNSRSNFREEVELTIIRDGDEWKVDDAQLEALLSLVSFSAWATKQNRRNREETEGEERSSTSDPSRFYTEQQHFENHQSIGWLRAEALDLQICDRIVGKSSSKLASDLSWWIVDAGPVSEEVTALDGLKGDRDLAISTDSSSSFEADYNEFFNPLTLRFYANNETSQKSSMYAI